MNVTAGLLPYIVCYKSNAYFATKKLCSNNLLSVRCMRVAMPFQSYRTNCSAVYSSAVSAATIASFYVGLGTFYTNVSIFFYLSVYLFFRLR